MARSTASSEPLTSPTPSPPRSPIPPQKPIATVPVKAPGLDSDSELSELSDDEEGNQPHDKQETESLRNGIAKTRSKAKRVLPGAMWDWAYKKKIPDTDPDDAVENQEQEGVEIEQDTNPIDNISNEHVPKLDPDIVDHHSTTPPGNFTEAEAIQKPTASRQTVQKPSGKGEDHMDIGLAELLLKKPPARLSPPTDKDPPQNNAPIPEDDDDDDNDNDEHSASDPENADDDENEVEDSASAAPNDENDEDEDIASSRPSSPVGTDAEGDDPPHPITKQSTSSLIAPISVSAPDPPELDGSPEPSEAEDPEVEVDQEEDVVDVGQDETGADNERATAVAEGEPEPDVEESAVHSSHSATPEPDLLEMPAHRAEALDALALIELKFALLRERLYVEKMEELVEEEGMIFNGTHPELIHLQMELSSRRNKRLELAMRRREYEEASIRDRKRDEANSVWEWWKHQRDGLQKEMISGHNRKRRKVERQRRAFEKTQPHRLIPRAPLPQTLPSPPPLATILDFESRAPYSIAYGQRPLRPTLSVLNPPEIEADLTYINGGKRRFWSGDGPGSSSDGGPGYVNGINGNGDLREVKERERLQRAPAMTYDSASNQHFRPVAMAPFPGEDPSANGWGKRLDEPGRSERERDRDRSNQQRQMPTTIYNHSIQPQSVSHTHSSHTHTHHPFTHTHPHTHPTHIHPHHHHVHVHHHHHNGPVTSPQPNNAPPLPPVNIRRFQDATPFQQHGHLSPSTNGDKSGYGPLDEKTSSGGFWRREEGDIVGSGNSRERDRERGDRERERERERDRDRRSGIDLHTSSGSIGYERILPSPFPSNSLRRRDSWDETSRPPISSPGSRIPSTHPLNPSRSGGSIGSPGRRPPGSPSHPNINDGPSTSVFPSSPRSVSIAPIPTGPTQISKHSNSRPLSPVPAKIVGGNSGSYLINANDNVRSNSRGEQGFGPGVRNDVYGESGDLPRRNMRDARVIAMNLTGVGGGSTTDTHSIRDRREGRLF
ncbi:hypothetical protein Clacol_009063 [Clathrus columnatus]|uniref:Uncharacterized protein n=1 Tax=Clathrus columnatus TaxID=1419009 RepID=A0AAV5APP1_9AGAM|nr:hypothetical protein Clacol_009063 [Clathrus columnatus]